MKAGDVRKGSTLVESSIILMVFLAVFVGILDMGQVLFFHNFLNDRVRTGARYAVVHAYDPAAIRNVVVYNSAVAPEGAETGLFGLAPAMVGVARYEPGTPNDRVEVSVSTYRMRFFSPWLAGQFTTGPFRAVMPLESAGAAQ
jgi:hypothetical protein